MIFLLYLFVYHHGLSMTSSNKRFPLLLATLRVMGVQQLVSWERFDHSGDSPPDGGVPWCSILVGSASSSTSFCLVGNMLPCMKQQQQNN